MPFHRRLSVIVIAVKARDTYQKHRVFFANEDTARACGFRPCGNCMKAEYKAWKAASESDMSGA